MVHERTTPEQPDESAESVSAFTRVGPVRFQAHSRDERPSRPVASFAVLGELGYSEPGVYKDDSVADDQPGGLQFLNKLGEYEKDDEYIIYTDDYNNVHKLSRNAGFQEVDVGDRKVRLTSKSVKELVDDALTGHFIINSDWMEANVFPKISHIMDSAGNRSVPLRSRFNALLIKK